MMIFKFKRPLLSSALVAALGAAYWMGALDRVIQPAYSERATATPEQVAADKLSSQLREWRSQLENRRFNSEAGKDAFSGMSWAPPPAAVAAPKGPVVPPFAYTYLGKLSPEDAKTILFLTKGEELYALNEGDLVEGVFRIEAIKDNHVEVVHVATQTRLTKRFDELAAPISTAQAGGTPGSPMAMAQAPSPAAGNPSAPGPDERRAREEKSDAKPGAMGVAGGRPAAATGQPAVSAASTPAAPSAPGSPMQMLPPGKPMEMTIPPANTVPPQGLNPTYPANVVPPQGAGK